MSSRSATENPQTFMEEFCYHDRGLDYNCELTEGIYYMMKTGRRLKDFEDFYAKNGRGDCVEHNYALFKEMVKVNPHLNLVCKYIRYRKTGHCIFHCCIYDGDFVIDESQKIRAKLPRYLHERSHTMDSTYEILAHKIYSRHNLPSLQWMLQEYVNSGSKYALSKLDRGNLPPLTGKWENAKNQIINM